MFPYFWNVAETCNSMFPLCLRLTETWKLKSTCFRHVNGTEMPSHVSVIFKPAHFRCCSFPSCFCKRICSYILPKHKREMVLWTTRNLNATAVLFNPVRPNETVVWLRSVGANETIVSFDLVDPNETSCVIWSGYPKKTVVCTELVGPNETAKIRHCIIWASLRPNETVVWFAPAGPNETVM